MKASEIFKRRWSFEFDLAEKNSEENCAWTKSNNPGTDIPRNYISIQPDGSGFNCKMRPDMPLFGNFSVYSFCILLS